VYVYAQVGVSLRTAPSRNCMGTGVDRSQLQPRRRRLLATVSGTTGIYVGNNRFIDAPHTGDVVKISSIAGCYASTSVGARRF
jgi:peptidoglycan DL-endopeptidase CwlO